MTGHKGHWIKFDGLSDWCHNILNYNKTLHCILGKLLNIYNRNSPKLWQSTFFQTNSCIITRRRPVMCGVILVTLHLIIVKLKLHWIFFAVSLFSVALCRRSLHTPLTDGWPQRSMLMSSPEDRLFWWKYSCSSFVYLTTVVKSCRLCFNNVSLMSYWSGTLESVNIFPTLPN